MCVCMCVCVYVCVCLCVYIQEKTHFFFFGGAATCTGALEIAPAVPSLMAALSAWTWFVQ